MKIKAVLAMGASLIITGCTQPLPPLTPHQAFTPRQRALASKIQLYGAFAHQQGTRLWVVIPTDTFFIPGTNRLFLNRTPPIANIAQLVLSFQNQHPGSRVRVMGFKNPKLTAPSARHSSRRFAKVITQYLQTFGVTQNIKTSTGTKKTSPTGLIDDSFSRRVIISVNA